MQRQNKERDVRAQPHGNPDQLPAVGYLRQNQLIPSVLPFSGSTLWRKVNAGEFPRPVKLSTRVTAWRVQDIRDWMASVDLVDKESRHA